jgi:GNAT superfamily N-acetyltransferase
MISRIQATEFEGQLEALADILVACVRGGASVSFMLPFEPSEALAFWRGLSPGIMAGRIVLLGAEEAGRLVGTVQLQLGTPPNQAHRAEVAKLLVHPSARGRGMAALLMRAIEAEALAHDRTLITLDTLTGTSAERLYLRLGYTPAGIIPDYARLPDGPLAPTTILYKRLEERT